MSATFPSTPAIISFHGSTSAYTQLPDIYDIADASSTSEILANNEIDPTTASAYWTASVGGWLGAGLYAVEFELRGEDPTEVDSDTEVAIIGVANRDQPIPYSTAWFGQELYQAGIEMGSGRLYSNGGTGTYLKNPSGNTWTATNLGALVTLVADTTVDPVKCYIYRANQVSAGFCRNPDNSIPDPVNGLNPNFTLAKTGNGDIRATIGDSTGTPDLRAIIIPAASRSLQ